MTLNLFFYLCTLLLSISAASADGSADFKQANEYYKTGDFTAAAAGYEKILATNGPRASVYYNLGNAYQNLKQYGPAILAYERARLITPRDPDLLANLTKARKAAAAFEEPTRHPIIHAILNFFSRNEWSWLVTGPALFIGLLAVIYGAERPRNQRIRKMTRVTLIIALLLIITAASALYLRRDEARHGIILTENALIHLSPFEKAESLGTPGQGKTVLIGKKHDDFYYIEVPNTPLHGWIKKTELQAITPN